MKSGTPATRDRLLQDPRDFSLVLGGPLFQLFRRAHLSDDELMLVRQRVIVISMFAWLPLLLLSALERQALRGSVAVPFLLDADVHFRFLIWARFLWQVSRIELNVAPMHPDRVGGLGFLSSTVDAFVPLAVAHGALLAGQFANRIFYLGAALPGFKVEVGVMVIFLLCVVFGPLLVFAPQLAQARRTGLREFGTLAQRYVREFDAKWLRGRAPADEPLGGSADIQSLADLGNSYESVG